MTVSAYLTDWLRALCPELKQSTYEKYSIYLTRHIIPFFDALGKSLEDLHPLDIREYVSLKRNGGRHDGKTGGLSAVSVRAHLNLIRHAFRDAVLYELIPKNPAAPVRLPRVPSVTRSARFLSAERTREILKAMEGTWLHPIVYITILYGLRRSEALGLRWSAVDFDRAEIRICHTVVKNLTIEATDTTKTDASYRTYPLLPEVAQILLPLRAGQSPAGYVFHREGGRFLRPDTLTKSFQKALRRHGLPRIRFHDLRHATASILFDEGWSVPDVQHWLGHADIETTMNIYTAYNSTRKLKVGGALTELLKP